MVKAAVVAALTCLFLLCSIALVQREGQIYRASRQQAGKSDLLARVANPPTIAVLETAPAAPQAPAASGRLDEPPQSQPVPQSKPTEPPSTTPAVETPRPSAPPTEAEPSKPSSAKAEAGKAEAPVAPAPAKYFRMAVKFDKDPIDLTLDEERQLGRVLNQIILSRHPQHGTGGLQRRMLEAARPILAVRERKDLEYHFVVLDSPAVNAFGHLGGYIYLTRGMFDLVADDTELQFVLAHEIAHVEERDDIKQLSLELRDVRTKADAKDNGPDPVQRLYHIIAIGHSDAQEFEADAWAFRQLTKLGHTRREALSFPLRFRGYVETNGLEAGRRPPKSSLEDIVQEVDNQWYAIVPAMERLDRLRALAGVEQKSAP
jgi:hypothetical protein